MPSSGLEDGYISKLGFTMLQNNFVVVICVLFSTYFVSNSTSSLKGGRRMPGIFVPLPLKCYVLLSQKQNLLKQTSSADL
jgi:hypothetical protein